jgi:hypothetical protein
LFLFLLFCFLPHQHLLFFLYSFFSFFFLFFLLSLPLIEQIFINTLILFNHISLKIQHNQKISLNFWVDFLIFIFRH